MPGRERAAPCFLRKRQVQAGEDGTRQPEQDHRGGHRQHPRDQDLVCPGRDRAIVVLAQTSGTDEPAAGPDYGQPGDQVRIPVMDPNGVGAVGREAQADELHRQTPYGGPPVLVRRGGDIDDSRPRLRPCGAALAALAPKRIPPVGDPVHHQQVSEQDTDGAPAAPAAKLPGDTVSGASSRDLAHLSGGHGAQSGRQADPADDAAV